MKIKLENISTYLIYFLIFLFPLFFTTIFDGIFETSKLLLLTVFVFLISVIKIVQIYTTGSLKFNYTPLDLSLLLLSLSLVLSLTFANQNKIAPLLTPGTVIFAILGTILYLFIIQLNKGAKNMLVTILLSVAFLVSVVQITSFFGVNQLIVNLPEVFKVNYFNTFGSILNHIVFLIAVLPILISKLIKNEDLSEKILLGIIATVTLISLSTAIFSVLPNKENSLKILDTNVGWSIAVDSIKNNPLFGAGIGNFGQSFDLYRPISFNQSADWSTKFSLSSSTVMTIVTEAGLISLIAIIYLLVVSLKQVSFSDPISVSGLILLISLFIVPLSMSFLVIVFIVLALNKNEQQSKQITFDSKNSSLILTIPLVILTTVSVYSLSRAFYADYLFNKAIKEVSQGKGIQAFELINKSIEINKNVDRYHIFSAGLSLAIAETIAQKDEGSLSDGDKQNISRLIQKAIEEGKAAVAINPKKSTNWEALSDIYRSISAFATGADEFAVQTLAQSIALDPINPVLRIKLGGLYYNLEKHDLAIEVFKLAVLAKKDLPNAHYNLALAYKADKQLDKAKESINNTLLLVGKDSTDYELAIKELENIEGLTKPNETPDPIIEPQIELPQE